MKIAKHIPNILTSIRIIASIVMLFLRPADGAFYAVYIIAGVSDVLDGVIARSMKTTSALGAKLDSAADILFYLIMIIKLLTTLLNEISLWVWIVAGAAMLIRIVSYVAAAIKYKKFASLHTYLNKATGFLVFLIPFAIGNTYLNGFAAVAAIVGGIASAEELLIHITTKKYEPRRKTLFFVDPDIKADAK